MSWLNELWRSCYECYSTMEFCHIIVEIADLWIPTYFTNYHKMRLFKASNWFRLSPIEGDRHWLDEICNNNKYVNATAATVISVYPVLTLNDNHH